MKKLSVKQKIILAAIASAIWLIFMYVSLVKADTNTTLGFGNCQTVIAFNSTDNTTYNATYCSPVTPTNTNGTCYVHKTVSENTSVINTTSPCDVDVEVQNMTSSFFCPACPIAKQVPVSNFTGILLPQEQNITFYNNWTDYCHLNFTVAQCPLARFNVPLNYSVISDTDLANYKDLASAGYQCFSSLGNMTIKQAQTSTQLGLLQQISCTVDKKKLLECTSNLPDYELAYLNTFSLIDYPVNSVDLAQAVYPQSTGDDLRLKQYYAEQALVDFSNCGFAQQACESQFSPYYQVNFTICTYKPLITQACLNETATLKGIQNASWTSGMETATEIIVACVVIWLLVMWFVARLPPMPIR